MTTTISSSGTINPLLLTAGESIVITGGNGVTVNTSEGLGLISLDDKFTVEDHATFELSSAIGVNVGDSFLIGNEGTLVVGDGVNVDVLSGISFTSGTAEDLIVDQGFSISVFSGVSGFAYGDSIDFIGDGAPVTGSVSTSFDSFTESTLFTTDTSKGAESFSLDGNYTGDTFSATADTNGGFTFADETPCFAQGTRILTARGEVRVEEIVIGDTVLRHDGTPAPVIFVGRRTVDCIRHPKPETARPVRIQAGALGQGVPHRDLLVSGDHALYLDGVLVPARDLVDGVMIRLDTAMPQVTYYHVELPQHGIILAEGAAAESFLNVGHRGRFENSGEKVIVHPEVMHRARVLQSVAPLVTGGPALGAIRAALHARALRRGYRVVDATALMLRVNFRGLLPLACNHDEVTFALPAGRSQALLLSDVFTPAEIDPSSNDRRVLGVAVRDMLVNGGRVAPEMIFDAADLHPRAADERAIWTRGAARLTLPEGTRRLTVRIAGWPRKWQAAAETVVMEEAVDARKRA